MLWLPSHYQPRAALDAAAGPPPPSITIRDTGSANNGANEDHDLISYLTLDFIAGNLLVVIQWKKHFGTTGTSALITQGTVTGWNEIGFAAQVLASGEDAYGVRGIWKVADGTEDNLTILTAAGAAGTVTNRTVTHGFSYDIVGTPSLVVIATPAQVTSGDPSSRVIPCAAEDAPMLAISAAHGDTQPDQSFDSQTPDQNVIQGATSPTPLMTRVKTKIFTASPADITTDAVDLGGTNSLLVGLITVA